MGGASGGLNARLGRIPVDSRAPIWHIDRRQRVAAMSYFPRTPSGSRGVRRLNHEQLKARRKARVQ